VSHRSFHFPLPAPPAQVTYGRPRALLWRVGPLVAVTLLLAASGAQAARSPALAWSPASHDYGTLDAGTTGSQDFTLSNSGGSASGALTIELSGSAAFSITSDGCTDTSLGPAKSCSVTVEYAPTTGGQSDAATLTASGKKPATVAASVTLTGTSSARHIYWTNDSFAPNGSVGRATVSGQNVNNSFISGLDLPVGIAVDSDHIYWSSRATRAIGRANLDATGVNNSFISGLGFPQGLAVDSNHIYWIDVSIISRANLDGTSAQPLVVGVGGQGLAVDSDHIYWTNFNAGTIGRANLDGTGVNNSFVTGASFPVAIAVDAGHVYWTNTSIASNSIGRANLDGTSVNQSFITGANNPTGLAVDSGHIYWANRGPNTIGRANLDGTSVNQSFITVTGSLFMVAVDPD